MYKNNIMLKNIEVMESFSNLANSFKDVNISLASENYEIDPKSIMSIFSLDLSKPLTVIVKGDCPKELVSKIKEYEI